MMTNYLMNRSLRKRKRVIYAKAKRAIDELSDALRDMREFAGEVTGDYKHAHSITDVARCDTLARVKFPVMAQVDRNQIDVEQLIHTFNLLSEEL